MTPSFTMDASALGASDWLQLELRGHDRLDLKGGAGDDKVVAGKKGLLLIDAGDGNNNVVGGKHADQIRSGIGDDILVGGHGRDALTDRGGEHNTLDGGSGDDMLSSGGGADTLIGGTGLDRFVFAAPSLVANMDTIADFTAGEHLDTPFHITAFDTAVEHSVSAATFSDDLTAVGANLAANHAIVFTAGSGDLAGHRYLLIGFDGAVGFNADTDWVIQIDGTAPITTATFI
ncbi:MAG TPA: bluetail domain-containing putative surface protein [Rhizomicrobium sp.]|jgi:Ca2+-binding RTX toxin-like protein|nr:bluetail domain-containing putative surface protein [Rhizomicrobium sp.]